MSKASEFDWCLMLASVVVIPLSILIGYVLINGLDLVDVTRKVRHAAQVEMMREHVTSWDGPYTKNGTDTSLGLYLGVDSYANYERPNKKPGEPLKLKLSTELSSVVNWDEWKPIHGHVWDTALSERK